MSVIFKGLFPENLYHSYVVEGDPDTVALPLGVYLREEGYVEDKSSDVICQLYDSFTVADSEKIKEWHNQKAVTEGKKICIIGTKFINHDAERTLLKMIEEPSINTHFFIVIPNSSMLLDTILSRVHVVKVDKEDNDSSLAKNAEEFIKNNLKERIDKVADLVEDHKEDEGSGGLRSSATGLVNQLEKIIYKKFQSDKDNTEIQFKLGELAKAREYLSLPGASVKMILEHIALVL